jgi:hypothetical protein
MRRPYKPSRRLTYDDAIEVWLMHWGGEIQSRIASRFDVNIGRISETLNSKRWPGSEAAAQRVPELNIFRQFHRLPTF